VMVWSFWRWSIMRTSSLSRKIVTITSFTVIISLNYLGGGESKSCYCLLCKLDSCSEWKTQVSLWIKDQLDQSENEILVPLKFPIWQASGLASILR
jgi:hypothetical protein